MASPEMRKYFLDGVDIQEDDKDFPKVMAITDLYCLYLEQIATQSRNIAPEHRESWLTYASSIYHKSPIIKSYLSDKKSWYAPEFWKAVEDYGPNKSINSDR